MLFIIGNQEPFYIVVPFQKEKLMEFHGKITHNLLHVEMIILNFGLKVHQFKVRLQGNHNKCFLL
jgi:hypothetical protein